MNKSLGYAALGLIGVYVLTPTITQLFFTLNPFDLFVSKDMQMLRRRKKVGRYTVGLANRANDCFANSNLQALAALQNLFVYLNEFAYLDQSELSLSRTLKHVVRDLNEPILGPKTLSPWTLLAVLEKIYKSRISRSQHDAHELLHLVLETLQKEHEFLKKTGDNRLPRFPFDGASIDHITCSKCGYCPPVSKSTFLVQSLMVPQKRSVSFNELLSQLSTPEYIKDYGCTNCRLRHVVNDPTAPEKLRRALYSYRHHLDKLPDELDQQLPRNVTSPIAKTTAFHKLPQVLTVHLSRSIYGGYGASRNSCKVSLQETIELYEQPTTKHKPTNQGFDTSEMLQTRRKVTYRLAAMIRHKGTHQTGHYECFRRKNLGFWVPTDQASMAAMQLTRAVQNNNNTNKRESSVSSTPPPPLVNNGSSSSNSQSNSSLPSTCNNEPPPVPPKNNHNDKQQELPYPMRSSPSPASVSTSDVVSSKSETAPPSRSSAQSPDVLPASNHEWWKVSDDKVWECSTRDVLKEESGAYLLFYETC